MTVRVRGPGETGGAFGFALIFLVLFVSRQKEQKDFSNDLSCALACPAGSPPQADDFFGSFLHQGKEEQKDFFDYINRC